MGIKDLTSFLKNRCFNCFSKVNMSEFRYKKIAIDTYIYLYNFKRISNFNGSQYGFIEMLASFITAFRVNNVHPVFILEGRSPPEKADERDKRAALNEKSEKTIADLEKDVLAYYADGTVSDAMLALFKKITVRSLVRLNDKTNVQNTDMSRAFNIEDIELKIKKMKANIVHFDKGDIDLCKTLFESLGVPYYVAPFEAETMCYDLYKKGLVDEILSDDTDVLAYGASNVLTKFNLSEQSFVCVNRNVILRTLEFTPEMFLDFCVMSGCDYNKNIYRTGCEGSYKLIRYYKSIEDIENTGLDVAVLKYELVRRMFNEYIPCNVDAVPYCDKPDFNKLRDLFIQCNIDSSVLSNMYHKYTSPIVFV